MGKVNVQFHAVPSEIFEFVEYCSKEHELEAVLMQFYPEFKIICINYYDFNSRLLELEKIDQICLCNTKPYILVNSPYDFLTNNPNCLSITIGVFDDQSLRQSFLSGQTDNTELLTIWKKIVKKLNSITSAGVWVENPHTGVKAFYNRFRYTSNAKELFNDGIRMLPVAGWNQFILSSE